MSFNGANWYTFDDLRSATGLSVRAARDLAGKLSAQVAISDPRHKGPGRPPKLYHYTAHPELQVHHETRPLYKEAREDQPAEKQQDQPAKPEPAQLHPDDLAVARLRLTAVKHYINLRAIFPESQAAAETVAWVKQHIGSRRIKSRENLPGNYKRKHLRQVTLSKISASSLRTWYRRHESHKKHGMDSVLVALAPKRKGKAGRRQTEIPNELLAFAFSLYCNSVRGDVKHSVEAVKVAIAQAQDRWPGEFPNVSLRTWQRRFRNMDASRAMRDLGQFGSATFASKHSPDIEVDHNQRALNDLWEIDDVQMDFPVHSQVDPTKLVRPRCYLIIRAATRQLLAFVESETPITKNQVERLVGFAMASENAGLPGHISFERGAVALSTNLEQILDDLGVGWHRTMMDGGRKWSGAVPDNNIGHFMGKPLIESNFRRLHNIMWQAVGNVGSDERNTAPQNLENIKKLSIEAVRNKQKTILPQWHEFRAFLVAAVEKFNTTPHSGLPKVWDVDSSQWRHLTPNERAAQYTDPIQVMDSRLLPAFGVDVLNIEVTKNGIRCGQDFNGNARWYGRWSDKLQELRGKKVTVCVAPELPDIAYIVELGECVERYQKDNPANRNQYGNKAHVNKKLRNQFEELMAQASDTGAMLGMIRTSNDPTPERETTTQTSSVIQSRVDLIRQASQNRKARKEHQENLTDFDRDFSRRPVAPSGKSRLRLKPKEHNNNNRRSLISMSNRYAAAGAALHHNT